MISIWRTIPLSDKSAEQKIMELAHLTSVRSGSVITIRVNKNYLVAMVSHNLRTNVDIEVLSTVDWSILFTVKDCTSVSDEFYFVDNIMIIQLIREDLARQGIWWVYHILILCWLVLSKFLTNFSCSPFLFRLIDCDKKSSKDIHIKTAGPVLG